MRHGYIYQENFLSPWQIKYWTKRIPKDIKQHGQSGTVVGAGGRMLIDKSYRRSSITFLDPYANQSHEDAIQARHLLYMLLGFALVAEGTHLNNLGVDLRFDQDATAIQLAQYSIDEKYEWHQDQDPIKGRKLNARQISIVLTVMAPRDGGQLEFRDIVLPTEVRQAINTPGAAVAFPSWAYHCVSPVLKGQRISITSWILGNERPAA